MQCARHVGPGESWSRARGPHWSAYPAQHSAVPKQEIKNSYPYLSVDVCYAEVLNQPTQLLCGFKSGKCVEKERVG